MALTLQQAFEQYKAARALAAEKKAARAEADDRAAEAKKDHLASLTAMDNAKAAFDGVAGALSEPDTK